MGRPEAYVESYLVKQAKRHNILCYKFVSPANNGVPDRILIGHGHVVFVETKAPGSKPRKLQLIVHEQMRAHGADVRVIDSREEVDSLLEEITSKNIHD